MNTVLNTLNTFQNRLQLHVLRLLIFFALTTLNATTVDGSIYED